MLPMPPNPEPTQPTEETIGLRCWCCRTTLVVPADRAGKELNCPQCYQTVKIPAPRAIVPTDVRDVWRRRVWLFLVVAGATLLYAAIAVLVRPSLLVLFVLAVLFLGGVGTMGALLGLGRSFARFVPNRDRQGASHRNPAP